jgi:hypothetical protein
VEVYSWFVEGFDTAVRGEAQNAASGGIVSIALVVIPLRNTDERWPPSVLFEATVKPSIMQAL